MALLPCGGTALSTQPPLHFLATGAGGFDGPLDRLFAPAGLVRLVPDFVLLAACHKSPILGSAALGLFRHCVPPAERQRPPCCRCSTPGKDGALKPRRPRAASDGSISPGLDVPQPRLRPARQTPTWPARGVASRRPDLIPGAAVPQPSPIGAVRQRARSSAVEQLTFNQ